MECDNGAGSASMYGFPRFAFAVRKNFFQENKKKKKKSQCEDTSEYTSKGKKEKKNHGSLTLFLVSLAQPFPPLEGQFPLQTSPKTLFLELSHSLFLNYHPGRDIRYTAL